MATKENQEPLPAETTDPFPKPQTIPTGWDISVLFTAPQPTSDEQPEVNSDSEPG